MTPLVLSGPPRNSGYGLTNVTVLMGQVRWSYPIQAMASHGYQRLTELIIPSLGGRSIKKGLRKPF